MKRLLTAAMVLSLVGGSAAMAQPYQNERHDSRSERHDDRNDRSDRNDRNDNSRYGNDRGDRYGRHDNGQHRGHYKKWARGERLPSEYRSRGHYVDYRRHHLRAPPRGYQWVQVNNDYMMIALATGLIASIIIANN